MPGVQEKTGMKNLEEKRDIVLQAELEFARELAARLMPGPEPSAWIILMPILFIFHVFEKRKISKSRGDFTRHYLVNLKRGMRAAMALASGEKSLDMQALAREADIPEEYTSWNVALLNRLCKHYERLLEAQGDDFENLVRSAYFKKTDFEDEMKRLNSLEQDLNKALIPWMQEIEPDVAETIEEIGEHVRTIRKECANRIYDSWR